MTVCVQDHHDCHHSPKKDQMRDEMLSKLCLTYEQVIQAYQSRDRQELEQTKSKREKIINSYLV